MSEEKQIKEIARLSRRAFLKYSGMGLVASTVIGMVPDIPVMGRVGWKAYAQSQKKISDEWWQVASKYGKPTGKYGPVGSPVTLTIGYQPYMAGVWTSAVNKQAQLLEKYLPMGSKVVWFRAMTGPLINNNMLVGKNQFGYMVETPATRTGDTVPCDLIACTGYDVGEFYSFIVRSELLTEGKVKEHKDLENMPIACTSGTFLQRGAIAWARYHNLKPSKFLDLGADVVFANLMSKNLAASSGCEPFNSIWEERGIVKIFFTGQDIPCTCEQYYPQAAKHSFRSVGTLISIFDFLRDRPDVIGAYLKAEEESRDMLTHDPDLAAYHISTDIADFPPHIIRHVLDMFVWDGRITPECRNHLKGVARMWREIGVLRGERSKDPDKFIDEWADDRYLRLAIKEMKAKGQWTSDNLPGFPKEIRPDQLKRHSWKRYKDIKLEGKPWKPTKV
jgi:NitT/TauT family transport system substrate-binding protein